jgi:hypothetical protein
MKRARANAASTELAAAVEKKTRLKDVRPQSPRRQVPDEESASNGDDGGGGGGKLATSRSRAKRRPGGSQRRSVEPEDAVKNAEEKGEESAKEDEGQPEKKEEEEEKVSPSWRPFGDLQKAEMTEVEAQIRIAKHDVEHARAESKRAKARVGELETSLRRLRTAQTVSAAIADLASRPRERVIYLFDDDGGDTGVSAYLETCPGDELPGGVTASDCGDFMHRTRMDRTGRDGLDSTSVAWTPCDFLGDGDCPCEYRSEPCVAGLTYKGVAFAALKTALQLESKGDDDVGGVGDADDSAIEGPWECGEYQIGHLDTEAIVALASAETWRAIDSHVDRGADE